MNLHRMKIKNYQYLYIQWCILAGLMLIYSFNIRNHILQVANTNNLVINQWDFILTYISDQKLMLFLILPHFLANTINLIFSQHNLAVLLRINSWSRFVKYTLYRNRFNIFGYIFLIVITSLIWRPSFASGQIWSNFMGPEASFVNDVIKSVSTMNITPISSYIIQLFLFTMFLVIINVIFTIIVILVKERRHVYLFGLGLNLFFIVAWSLPGGGAPMNLLKYIYLYGTVKQPFYVILILICIIFLNFLVAKKIKYNNFGYKNSLQR